ncbi:MAG: hypothetical protein NT154_38035 [Verrucomicrobia bacterium]|nr:hypothetical protein [Verrucomicrobiota bacterium]
MAGLNRAGNLFVGILLVVASALCAVAAEEKIASPIPLEKGSRWVYEAKVKWTPVAGTGRTRVRSARIKWTTEVLDCVQGNSTRAAVVHAFPMEILGLDPVKPVGYTVLIATSNRLYFASAKSPRKATALAPSNDYFRVCNGDSGEFSPLDLR